MPNLLIYLIYPNPAYDNTHSTQGGVTCNSRWSDVTGIEEWREFDYQTLISMYGTILENTAAEPPAVSPPLQSIECEIWDEDSLEHFLTRSIVPFVNHSLGQAWGYCRKNWSADDFSGPAISMGRGGRAMNPTYDNDNRYRPDWAGIREDIKSKRGTSYRNLCPGDTKLSTKWQSTLESKKDWLFPIQQIQSYCE